MSGRGLAPDGVVVPHAAVSRGPSLAEGYKVLLIYELYSTDLDRFVHENPNVARKPAFVQGYVGR